MFTFPALEAGPPSRRNWYKELLDHPDCLGNSARVQEAYSAHRDAYNGKQAKSFQTSERNPVTADQALIKHLERQKRGDPPTCLDDQDVNCLVVWARPNQALITLVQTFQARLVTLIGTELHPIPLEHLHLSVIEFSHRHSVPQLRKVADGIGHGRIKDILNIVQSQPKKPKICLPQLGFDKMGIALNFVPSKDDAYTYHHLRSDMHSLALESGLSFDMCYTAPSAHVTVGRFIGNSFFENENARSKFLSLVEEINGELRKSWESDNLVWAVTENASLELQLGYLKFGRERKLADWVG